MNSSLAATAGARTPHDRAAYFFIDDASGPATDGEPFTLTVTRSGVLTSAVSVDWAATGEIFAGSSGFEQVDDVYSGTLTFNADETAQILEFTLRTLNPILLCVFAGASDADVIDPPAVVTTAGPGGIALSPGRAQFLDGAVIRWTAPTKLQYDNTASLTCETLLTSLSILTSPPPTFSCPILTLTFGGGSSASGFGFQVDSASGLGQCITRTGSSTLFSGFFPITGAHFAIVARGLSGADYYHNGVLVHSVAALGAVLGSAFIEIGRQGVTRYNMTFTGVRHTPRALYSGPTYVPPTSLDVPAVGFQAVTLLSNPSSGSRISDGTGQLTATPP